VQPVQGLLDASQEPEFIFVEPHLGVDDLGIRQQVLLADAALAGGASPPGVAGERLAAEHCKVVQELLAFLQKPPSELICFRHRKAAGGPLLLPVSRFLSPVRYPSHLLVSLTKTNSKGPAGKPHCAARPLDLYCKTRAKGGEAKTASLTGPSPPGTEMRSRRDCQNGSRGGPTQTLRL